MLSSDQTPSRYADGCNLFQNGNSVLLHVSSFLPYLYVAAPRGFTNDDCREFSNSLNVRRC